MSQNDQSLLLEEVQARGRLELVEACRKYGVAKTWEVVQEFEGDHLVVAEIPEDGGYHIVILSWNYFNAMLDYGRMILSTVYTC